MRRATRFRTLIQTLRHARKGAAAWLLGLLAVQILCAAFFLADVGRDLAQILGQGAMDWHLLPELAAGLGLGIGIVLQLRFLADLIRQEASMARGLTLAAGALATLMEGYFQDWGLTPAEIDVAGFTIKGYSIAEIAQMRGSAEGTVKTQLNAIYRKAGVTGRAQLVSLLVEDLLRAPLLQDGDAAK